MKLKGEDRVIGGCAVAHEEIVVLATEHGYAKRTAVDEFPVQARGGSGLKAAKIDKARGAVAAVAPAAESIAFVTKDGAVVVPSSSVRAAARRRRFQGRRGRRGTAPGGRGLEPRRRVLVAVGQAQIRRPGGRAKVRGRSRAVGRSR